MSSIETSTQSAPPARRPIRQPRWRAVTGGVVAILLLTSLVGGIAAAATWGLAQVITGLVS